MVEVEPNRAGPHGWRHPLGGGDGWCGIPWLCDCDGLEFFKVCWSASVYEMEPNWSADVDETSLEHSESFALTPTFTQAHRAPSQMHLRTSRIFGGRGYTAVGPLLLLWICCGEAAIGRSVGLWRSSLLLPIRVLIWGAYGCPESGSEGVLPPLCLELSPILVSAACQLTLVCTFTGTVWHQ